MLFSEILVLIFVSDTLILQQHDTEVGYQHYLCKDYYFKKIEFFQILLVAIRSGMSDNKIVTAVPEACLHNLLKESAFKL